jgi:ubiquitin carboxyl-terminal hydrolase 14
MRDLFVVMDVSNQAATPLAFLTVMRRAFPQFSQQDHGHYMQQDAEECWTQLMLALSQKLPRAPDAPALEGSAASSSSSSSRQSVISDLFVGEKETTQKCVETEEPPTTKRERLDKLVCHIGNTTSFMVAGLKEGLEETLSKNNESLGREAKYTQSSRITRLPYYLTVQFMRFFWRADKKVKAKIVRPVEFPLILDVYDLCAPDLQKELGPKRRAFEEQEQAQIQKERERAKRKAEDPDAKEEPPKDDPMQVSTTTEPAKPYSNTLGKYELIAVLTHKGREAEAGHYIAWVKQAKDKWLKYDDDKVSEVRDEEIKKLDGKGGGDWHIAYMCLYRSYNP